MKQAAGEGRSSQLRVSCCLIFVARTDRIQFSISYFSVQGEAGPRDPAPTIAFRLKVVILSAAKNPFIPSVYHEERDGFLSRKLLRNDKMKA